MTTYISTPDINVYTDLGFEDTHAALVDGKPIACWWYSNGGKRFNETFVFTDFRYISTCKELERD